MAKTLLRDKARELRSVGKSLNEITKSLDVPKSTVRFWCRDISLNKVQLKRLSEKQKIGALLAAEKRRKERKELIKHLFNEGIKEINILSKKEMFLTGLALYWAEGYQKGDGEFGFTNANPQMIRFIIKWLEQTNHVVKKRIHLRICINSVFRYRIKEIRKFWSKAAGIPICQFDKSTLIKVNNKKLYKNSSKYFGTLRVKVYQSTNFKRKIMGWIEGLARNY